VDMLSTAAGIASIVDGRDPQAVMAKATERCRSVTLDQVEKDDFSSTVPIQQGLDLNGCTKPTRLGEIDAFISHSWHDDVEAKWAALQTWRRNFRAQHGREPRVWIDKYCINQANVVEDLSCLPVFLAGSRQLVILYGHTYLQRLWCIMEVLIFLLMGGLPEEVCIQHLETKHECPDTLKAQLDGFSVKHAACSKPEDKEMLLAIVEAGFGGCKRFDRAVVDMMHSVKENPSLALLV